MTVKTSNYLSDEEQKIKIIATAGKLIKAHIEKRTANTWRYPSFSTVSSVEENTDFIPDSLRLFVFVRLCRKEIKWSETDCYGSSNCSVLQAQKYHSSTSNWTWCPLYQPFWISLHNRRALQFRIFCVLQWGSTLPCYCSIGIEHNSSRIRATAALVLFFYFFYCPRQ